MENSVFSIVISDSVLNSYIGELINHFTSQSDIQFYIISNDNTDEKNYENTELKFISTSDIKNDSDIAFVSEKDDLIIEACDTVIVPASLYSNEKEFILNKLNHMRELNDLRIRNHDFIQQALLYNIYEIIDLNLEILENDLKESREFIKNILKDIDKNDILNFSYFDKNMKSFLIYLKNNENVKLEQTKDNAILYTDDYLIDDLSKETIKLDIIDLHKGYLNISGYMKTNFNYDSLKIIAKKNNKEILESYFVEYLNTSRKTIRFLSIDWVFYYNFDLKIPITDESTSIQLKTVFNENIEVNNQLSFKKYANISNYAFYSAIDSQILVFSKNKLNVIPYSLFKTIEFEIITLLKIIKSQKMNWHKSVFYRISYNILKPFMKNRKIWLFEDRPSFGDDNAEHLFKYAVKQDDGVEKYFILDKNSSDFKRLNEIDENIIPFGSIKHKMLYLFSDKLISSHVDRIFLDPFDRENPEFINSLKTFRRYFLQHGIIKDDLSHWLRKYYHNLNLFVTSTDLERNSILNSYYNYDRDIVQVLGLPRYDNLKSEDVKKEILLMPTWRSYLKTDEDFLNSDYFKRLNSFLNNEKLIEILTKTDYKILFKPHYNLLKFINCFDIDEKFIRISIDEPYQKLFNQSALMITDYSSVFFDFAYLKKPIIYYHESEDYHYKKSYFNYETMGFGEVVKSEDELLNKIEEYVKNNCHMRDKYKQRVDKFFKYHDQNNCKRVYEWIKKDI